MKKYLLLFFVIPFFFVPKAHAAMTLVQFATSTFTTNGTNLASTTFTSTPATNDLIIASVGTFYNGTTTLKAYDNKGNAYTDLAGQGGNVLLASGTHFGVDLFYAVAATSSATFKVSVSSTQSGSIYSMIILEYSGAATTNLLDKNATSTNAASTTISTGNITTTSTGELYVAVQTHGGSPVTTSPGVGWSDHHIVTEDQNNYVPLSTEDQLGPASGTYNGKFTMSGSAQTSAGIIVSFEPASTPATAVANPSEVIAWGW